MKSPKLEPKLMIFVRFIMELLPVDIILEILSFVNSFDQKEFCRINRSLCKNIPLKRYRKLHLMLEKDVITFFQTSQHPKLNLIMDQNRQLHITVNFDPQTDLSLLFGLSPLTVHFLQLSGQEFLQIPLNSFQCLQDLCLQSVSGLTSSNDVLLSDLKDKFDQLAGISTSVGLKSLSIYKLDLEGLPVIPSLEILSLDYCRQLRLENFNISQFSHLRCVKIKDCLMIRDVRCLDSIYQLEIIRCNGIQNISSLNHNTHIAIKNCMNIRDYSNSFRFSQHISLDFSDESEFIPLNIDNLSQIKELNLVIWNNHPHQSYFIHSKPFPRSLKSMKVHHVFIRPDNTYLPLNYLKELSLIRCYHQSSLINFENIYKIVLINLQIQSLEGLGPKNRCVSVIDCDHIRDFSPLNNCEKVIVKRCRNFVDTRILSNVKELHVEQSSDLFLRMNLQAVTHLTLNDSSTLTNHDFLRKSLLRVKVFSITCPFNEGTLSIFIDFFKIMQELFIEKIELNEVDSYLLEDSSILENLGFDVQRYYSQLILLFRKKLV